MSMSGVKFDDTASSAVKEFDDIKHKRSICFLRLDAKKNCIHNEEYLTVEDEHDVQELIDQVREHSKEGLWLVFTLSYEVQEGTTTRTQESKCLLKYVDDNTPVRIKMIMGSTHEFVKREIKANVVIDCNSLEDVTLDKLREACSTSGVNKLKLASDVCLKNAKPRQKQ